jgi:hypothetical protein
MPGLFFCVSFFCAGFRCESGTGDESLHLGICLFAAFCGVYGGVGCAGAAAQKPEGHPRITAKAGINLFIGIRAFSI